MLLLCLVFSGGAVHSQTALVAEQPKAVGIRFKDFFKMPIGPRGLEPSDTLRRADGRLVTLTGFMVQQETPEVGHFMLTARPVHMSEHADGDADDLPPATVLVNLDPAQRHWVVAQARGVVSLTGVLALGRHEGPRGRIVWLQLQLGPDAVRGMNPLEQALYQHNLQHKH